MRVLAALTGAVVCVLSVSAACAQAEKTGDVQFTLMVGTQQLPQHPGTTAKKRTAEDLQNTILEAQRCFRDTVKQIAKKATVQGVTDHIVNGGYTFRGNFTAEGIAPDAEAVCKIYTILSALQNLPGVESCNITVETRVRTPDEGKK